MSGVMHAHHGMDFAAYAIYINPDRLLRSFPHQVFVHQYQYALASTSTPSLLAHLGPTLSPEDGVTLTSVLNQHQEAAGRHGCILASISSGEPSTEQLLRP